MFRFIHRYGFGIQSPWAYSLVKDVLYEPLRYYAFDSLRQALPKQTKQERKLNEQLFRIVNHFKPSTIITSGCVDAAIGAYIKMANDKVSFVNTEQAALPIQMFYVSPESDAEKVMQLINREGATDENSIIIIEDIYKKNKTLWEQVQSSDRISVTFDMKPRGMAFTDLKRVKQNYKL